MFDQNAINFHRFIIAGGEVYEIPEGDDESLDTVDLDVLFGWYVE